MMIFFSSPPLLLFFFSFSFFQSLFRSQFGKYPLPNSHPIIPFCIRARVLSCSSVSV